MPGPIEPTLKYGLICEHLLIERDGVLSFIRIVDKFTLTIRGEKPPSDLPAGNLVLRVAMCWVGGLGTHEAAFNIVSPGGDTQESQQTWSFNLDAIHKGHAIIATMTIEIKRAGVYWIEFLLNSRVVGRSPFQVVYERQQVRA